jgi:hypothetical protein
MACNGNHATANVVAMQRPQSSPRYTGPVVEAMRPGPNGPYRVRALLEEARAKGWEVLTKLEDDPELKATGGGWYELPDGTKVQGKAKARSALNKARGPGGHK